MEYSIKIKPKARKELARFPEKDRLRIQATLSFLRHDPFQGKKLKGKYQGYYSVRAWPYRITYGILQGTQEIVVIEMKHRSGAYRAQDL